MQVPIHPVRTPRLPHGSVGFRRCHVLPDYGCQLAAMVDKAEAITHLQRNFVGAMTSRHRAEHAWTAAASPGQLGYSLLPPNRIRVSTKPRVGAEGRSPMETTMETPHS